MIRQTNNGDRHNSVIVKRAGLSDVENRIRAGIEDLERIGRGDIHETYPSDIAGISTVKIDSNYIPIQDQRRCERRMGFLPMIFRVRPPN
ncbi:hypothetical protein GCM10022626_04200 [[Pseudomonas] carboxydohydrogena]